MEDEESPASPEMQRSTTSFLAAARIVEENLNRSSSFRMPRLSTASLGVMWALAFVAALASGVLADVFQGNAPDFPLAPTINISVGMNLLCSMLSILLGYNLFQSYSVYQPFAGGERYVLMQSCGWTLLWSCSVLMVVYVVQMQAPYYRYGVLAVLEALASLGNVFLVLSLRFFLPDEARRRGSNVCRRDSTKALKPALDSLLHSPNSETGLVVIFLLAQLVLCGAAAASRLVAPTAMILFTGFHVLSGVLIHFIIGWRYTRGYKLFTLVVNGPADTLYLIASWSLYFVVLAGGVLLFRAASSAPQLAWGMIAIAAVPGVMLPLVFVRTTCFDSSQSRLKSMVSKYSRLILSAVAVATSGVSVGITCYVETHQRELKETAEGKLWMRGLLYLQKLSIVFLLVLSPATNLMGKVIYDKSFSFFQPFRGSATFVFLQGLGWAFFGASLLFLTLHMTAVDSQWVFLAAAAGVTAQVFIQISIQAFDASVSHAMRHVSSPTSAMSCATNERKTKHSEQRESQSEQKEEMEDEEEDETSILNGELIVSYLLQLISIILRIVVDFSRRLEGDAHTTALRAILGFAGLAYMVSTPLAHASGRGKGIPLFRPFEGSGTYVALQALGWTVYTAFLLRLLHLFVSSTLNPVLSAEQPASLWFTFFGVLHSLPLLLITLSLLVEARVSVSQRRGCLLVLRALDVLKVNLSEGFDGRDATEQEALQKALETVAASGLSAHGVRFDRHRYHLGKSSATTTGGHEMADLFSDGRSNGDALPYGLSTEAGTRHGAATLLVLMLSLSSASSYILAALWAPGLALLGITFSVCGFAVSTLSCVGVHCIYGMLLHSRSGAFAYFMPFQGGSVFVTMQMAGWVSYSCLVIVTLMTTLDDVGNPVALLAGALLSVASQLLLLASIPKFDPRNRRRTYIEENGEGVVALLIFTGALVFTHVYLRVSELFKGEGDAEINEAVGNTASAVGLGLPLTHLSKRSRVPIVISALSMVAAVPIVIITLSRSAQRWMGGAKTAQQGDDAAWHRREVILRVIASVTEVLMMLIGATAPVTLVFMGYYMMHSHHPGLLHVAGLWFRTALLAVGLALVLSIVPHVLHVGVPSGVVHFRHCVASFFVFSLPTIALLICFSPSILLPFHSVGAYFMAFTTLFLCVVGLFRQARMVVRFVAYALLGYISYREYHRMLEGESRSAMVRSVISCVIDVAQLMLVLWYIKLFDGNPEVTGSRRSEFFRRWASKYLFQDMEAYFNFGVITDGDSVNLRDSKNQYIFSFHPHGVLPGTALLCTMTKPWRDKIGHNDDTFVSTHAANVVFTVPIVRDFNLHLGSLQVSRRVIGKNLQKGNSSIIVTGGQAEMLLTARSDKSLSLVTYHHGFIRLALEHRVPLVPLICFGENNVMDIPHVPRMQRATLKLLGFPIPMVPIGRWFLPLPHPARLTLVVGSSIPIPPGASHENAQDVEALTKTYFAEVKRLFYQYREEAGYPEMELVLRSK